MGALEPHQLCQVACWLGLGLANPNPNPNPNQLNPPLTLCQVACAYASQSAAAPRLFRALIRALMGKLTAPGHDRGPPPAHDSSSARQQPATVLEALLTRTLLTLTLTLLALTLTLTLTPTPTLTLTRYWSLSRRMRRASCCGLWGCTRQQHGRCPA